MMVLEPLCLIKGNLEAVVRREKSHDRTELQFDVEYV